MEKKLAEYRLRQRKNELLKSVNKLTIWPFSNMEENTAPNFSETLINKTDPPKLERPKQQANSDTDEISVVSTASTANSDIDSTVANPPNCLDYFLYILYFIFWTTLFFVFVKLGFGTVFIVISALVGIYLNTGTKPKKDGEMSAYSVFNENCERIDGTLSAEQFEREIGYKL